MKKIILIFILITGVVFCSACSTIKNHMPAKGTLAQNLEYAIIYLNDNYIDYNFERYISFGASNFVDHATSEEKAQLSGLVDKIIQTIDAGESFEPNDMETPSGAAAFAFELDELLFEIWHREVN